MITSHQFAMISFLSALTTLTGSVASGSDEVPGPPQTRPVALVNGTIHPIVDWPVENGTIIFEHGRITQIGQQLSVPADAEVIDLNGLHVYPGLIEAHSQIGLKEISAVRATRDSNETGSLNPNVRANVSVNPDSELIPVTRANGILTAVSAPAGGRISGMAAVMQLDGWTYEDMTLKASAALIINWPSPPSSGESPGLKILRRMFDDTRAYQKARAVQGSGQRFDIRFEAMIPVLNKDVPVMALAHDAAEIQAAVAFAEEQGIRLIIFGGHDAVECAELLKQHDVPVVIDAIHRRPRRRHEAYDTAYTLPARLQQAGVTFCISGSDRSDTWNARNLPYQAATAAAHGLSYNDALRSVTLFPAQILGIADRVGSLEPGKDATLIVTTGDPLETATQVTRAYVQGRPVQLSSRHTRLYDKYTEKYRQQNSVSE
ncbi:MAG: amidohydrolase family protein [Fuerstiella sp.]